MTMYRSDRTIAYHEAGHAVGFLAHGSRITELVLDDEPHRGHCTPAAGSPPEVTLLAVLCGPAAERLLGGNECAELSEGDARAARQAEAEAGPLTAAGKRAQQHRAEQFVLRNTAAITTVADSLLAHRRLDAEALGVLCRSRSALLPFKGLYPQPRPLKVSRGQPDRELIARALTPFPDLLRAWRDGQLSAGQALDEGWRRSTPGRVGVGG